MTPGAILNLDLADQISQFYADPLGFVTFAYPWGEPNGPLAAFAGPQMWQAERQIAFGQALKSDRGKGQFAMTNMESQTLASAMYVLSKSGLVDFNRMMVLRTASKL